MKKPAFSRALMMTNERLMLLFKPVRQGLSWLNHQY